MDDNVTQWKNVCACVYVCARVCMCACRSNTEIGQLGLRQYTELTFGVRDALGLCHP